MRRRRFGAWSVFGALALNGMGCQLIGGIDDLSVAGSGAGGAGAGAGGTAATTSSNGSSTNQGAGGADPGVTPLWAVSFGDATIQLVSDVAVDAEGNIAVVGSFLGTLDFGPPTQPLVSGGDYDGFAVKFTPDGAPVWAVRIGGAGTDKVASVVATPATHFVVTGEFAGLAQVTNGASSSPIQATAGADAFVIKLDKDTGAPVWMKQIGGSKDQQGYALAQDPSNSDLIVAGAFNGTIDLGNGSTMTGAGLEDIFLMRYDSTAGALIGHAQGGDGASQMAMALAVGPSKETFLAAQFDGALDIMAAGQQTSAGGGDVFVAKIPAALADPRWSRRFGDTNPQTPRGIAAGPDGSVVVVGHFEGSFDVNGKALVGKGGQDGFVVKYDNTGAPLWIRAIADGDSNVVVDDQRALDVAIDPLTGNIFVTGLCAGAVDLGDGVITGPGDADLFLVELSPGGDVLWSMRRGSASPQYGRAVALDGMGNLILAGDFRETLDFGMGPMTSVGSNDVFVSKWKIPP